MGDEEDDDRNNAGGISLLQSIPRPAVFTKKDSANPMWDKITLEAALKETKGAHRSALQSVGLETPIFEMLGIMCSNKIDSMPIVNKKKKAVKKASVLSPNFLGCVASVDVVDYILRGGDLASGTVQTIVDTNEIRAPEFSIDYIDGAAQYTLRDMATENFLWQYTPLKRNYWMHGSRLFVSDNNGMLVDVFTETDLTNVMNVYPPLLGDLAATAVMDVWGTGREVVTVRDNMNVLEAYRLMRSNGFTSVPVVDGFGVLQADLCVADISGLRESDYKQLLASSVVDFLKAKNNNELKFANIVPSSMPQHATIREAMGKKSIARNHRLYI
eukprot:PhF_6_TR40524/c0_g1_i2/m.60693